ncbi:hypothetical protein [Azospirillum halopraeferens]|uniref:hypothetical protein n=1 Tax=Azospirillum halopraeferens TaxID=34010 RepID=UPI00041B9678|nr:hypothetical protein [Azospirillum halopraeferens]
MADSSIGRSEPLIRSAVAVERAGTATDRHPQRREQQERRSKEKDAPRRRRIHDLLFEEIDQIDALEPGQRERIKRNIRTHFAGAQPATPVNYGQPPPSGEPAGDAGTAAEPEHPAGGPPADADTPVAADHEPFVRVAAPVHPHLPPDEAAENARLARQLRDCLALHTERARKIAVYLHLLLALHHTARPRFVVDV